MAAGLRRCAHGLAGPPHCTDTCFLLRSGADRALYTPNLKSVVVVSRSGRSSLKDDWLKAPKPSDLLLFSFDPFTFFPASSSSVRDFRCCPGVDDLEFAINDTDIETFSNLALQGSISLFFRCWSPTRTFCNRPAVQLFSAAQLASSCLGCTRRDLRGRSGSAVEKRSSGAQL